MKNEREREELMKLKVKVDRSRSVFSAEVDFKMALFVNFLTDDGSTR